MPSLLAKVRPRSGMQRPTKYRGRDIPYTARSRFAGPSCDAPGRRYYVLSSSPHSCRLVLLFNANWNKAKLQARRLNAYCIVGLKELKMQLHVNWVFKCYS